MYLLSHGDPAYRSLRYITPSFITKKIFSVCRMFPAGSPGMAITSASSPGSSVPMRF